MTDWDLMFTGVQKIVQSAANPSAGFQQLLTFAAQNPDEYSDTGFWKSVAASEMPFNTLKSWAKEGFDSLTGDVSWSLVVLDCGDCPDIFRPMEAQLESQPDFDRFVQIARTDTILHDFERYPSMHKISRLTDHYISELNHPILGRTGLDGREQDFCQDSGYLLWLTVCTLALVDVLRDVDYCRTLVQKRGNMPVISGYEEIFFYVGIITETGFRP